MPKPRRPKGNALKHGVFSAIHFLPREDPGDFEKLRIEVFEEWLPEGATEEDAALDIARALWLRRRYENYKAKRFSGAFISSRQWRFISDVLDSALFRLAETIDEWMEKYGVEIYPAQLLKLGDAEIYAIGGLIGLSQFLADDREQQSIDAHIDTLAGSCSTYLREELPASKFETTRDWAFALKKLIDTILIPQALKDLARVAAYAAQEKFGEAMLHDLAINERINMMLEKTIKRLVQVKVIKQMRVSHQETSAARQIEA